MINYGFYVSEIVAVKNFEVLQSRDSIFSKVLGFFANPLYHLRRPLDFVYSLFMHQPSGTGVSESTLTFLTPSSPKEEAHMVVLETTESISSTELGAAGVDLNEIICHIVNHLKKVVLPDSSTPEYQRIFNLDLIYSLNHIVAVSQRIRILHKNKFISDNKNETIMNQCWLAVHTRCNHLIQACLSNPHLDMHPINGDDLKLLIFDEEKASDFENKFNAIHGIIKIPKPPSVAELKAFAHSIVNHNNFISNMINNWDKMILDDLDKMLIYTSEVPRMKGRKGDIDIFHQLNEEEQEGYSLPSTTVSDTDVKEAFLLLPLSPSKHSK